MGGIFARLSRYYYTLRPLRTEQLFYRLYFPLKRCLFVPSVKRRSFRVANAGQRLQLPSFPEAEHCFFPDQNGFCFLNERVDFGRGIDWCHRGQSRLWRFHLYYFNWLRDRDISVSDRLNSIVHFIENKRSVTEYNHSYPAALRLRNWIAFILEYGIQDNQMHQFLYRDALLIYRFPEYNIGGNHLLESGLSLLWAGVYFDNSRMLRKAESILERELDRQILSDGAHYERSIGYHTFIQKNILETILFLNEFSLDVLVYKKLKNKLLQMISYLKLLSDDPRLLPHFGDSNPEMVAWTSEMDTLAQNLFPIEERTRLSVASPKAIKLMQRGGFQVFFFRGTLLSVDQPGHSHADTGTFCMNINGLPCIVDPGVSTYESGPVRARQRGTSSHNTLVVGGADSSEVWSVFRMARRAHIFTLSESDFSIDFEHDGYFNSMGVWHRRSISLRTDSLHIADECRSLNGEHPETRMMLHFHPERHPVLLDDGSVLLADCGLKIQVEGAVCSLEEYDFCLGFGKTIKALKINALINRNKINTLIELIDGQTH